MSSSQAVVCIAVAHRGRVSLYRSNGNDLTRRFPSVAAALAELPAGTRARLRAGYPGPGRLPGLRGADAPAGGTPCLLAFDMLALAGRDLCAEAVEDRKKRLRDVIAGRTDPTLQNTDWIAGEGRALFEAIRARGMEGIVAKKFGSRYVPGQRTGAWIKVKAGLRARSARLVRAARTPAAD